MTSPRAQPIVHAPAAGGAGHVVRTLKDGYWDRTEVVQLGDGSLRVRKSSKGDAPPGPWGVAALRKEIEYLSTLPDRARAVFPPVLAAWDDTATEPPRVGYEVPFYAGHADAGELARKGALAQVEIDLFQEMLAEALLERVHAPHIGREPGEGSRTVRRRRELAEPSSGHAVAEVQPDVQPDVQPEVRPEDRPEDQPLSAHVVSVVEHALRALEAEPELARLIRAESIRLNGGPQAGPRVAFVRALADGAITAALDAEPQVRLHGDLLLENMLWRRADAESSPGGDPAAPAARHEARLQEASEPGPCDETSSISPRLVLIDPVSVAGVASGPPLFDLVKYESYATGELPALRSEWLDVGGFDGGDDYWTQIRWQSAELAPFRTFDWHTRFRRAFEAKYGPVQRRAFHLIDGYFSVAMAVNTKGAQRRARLLKATQDFNAAGK